MSYNLTNRQQKILGWMVDQARGSMQIEEFLIAWPSDGPIVEDVEDSEVPSELTRGVIDVLAAEGMVRIARLDLEVRCTLTRHAFEAVDSNFGLHQKQEDEEQLYHAIMGRFNDDELRTLCFRLGVDYDDLGGTAKSGKARELVLYMKRKRRLQELIHAVNQT